MGDKVKEGERKLLEKRMLRVVEPVGSFKASTSPVGQRKNCLMTNSPNDCHLAIHRTKTKDISVL